MENFHLHERRFHGAPDRLRSPERLVLLEVDRVVALSLRGLTVQSILDVGTGTGVFAEAFSKQVLQVTGIDTNTELLDIARHYVPAAQFREAPAEVIPFQNGSFDLVFLGLVLHETDDAIQALQEARRVTLKRVMVLEWPYLDEEQGPPLAHRLKPKAIADYAGKAGFQKVKRTRLRHMELFRLDP
jgi:ubiquinone/menaquinone biosynthesis C-methylase UbiE